MLVLLLAFAIVMPGVLHDVAMAASSGDNGHHMTMSTSGDSSGSSTGHMDKHLSGRANAGL